MCTNLITDFPSEAVAIFIITLPNKPSRHPVRFSRHPECFARFGCQASGLLQTTALPTEQGQCVVPARLCELRWYSPFRCYSCCHWPLIVILDYTPNTKLGPEILPKQQVSLNLKSVRIPVLRLPISGASCPRAVFVLAKGLTVQGHF